MKKSFKPKIVNEFELSLLGKSKRFFDSEEFNEIIEYYLLNSNKKKAKLVLDEAKSIYPFSNELKISEAFYYLNSKDYKQAKTIITEYLEIDKLDSDAWVILSEANYNLKLYKENIEYLLPEYIKISSQFDNIDVANFYYNIANSEEKLKNYTSAINLLEKGLEFDFENEIELERLFYLYKKTKKDDNLELFLKKMSELEPFSPIIWFYYGRFFYEKKDYTEAIMAFEYAIINDKEVVESFFYLFRCFKAINNIIKAKETIDELAEFGEPDCELYVEIAFCYNEINELLLAEKFYEKTLSINQNHFEALIGSGELFLKQNKINESIYFFNRAFKLKPDNYYAMYQLANNNFILGNFFVAQSLYKKCLEKKPTFINAIINYSILIFETFDQYEAIDFLYEKIKDNIFIAEINILLTCFYIQLKDFKSAFLHLKIAKTIDKNFIESICKYYPEMINDPFLINLIGKIEE